MPLDIYLILFVYEKGVFLYIPHYIFAQYKHKDMVYYLVGD